MRDKEKREVDFALVNDGKIMQLIEAKYSDSALDGNLHYFAKKYQFPGTQIVCNLSRSRMVEDIPVTNARQFLEDLIL